MQLKLLCELSRHRCVPLSVLCACAGELFVRKLASRVAARVAQESLGSGPVTAAPVQGAVFVPSPSFMAGQESAGVGSTRGPLAGLLPDWLLP